MTPEHIIELAQEIAYAQRHWGYLTEEQKAQAARKAQKATPELFRAASAALSQLQTILPALGAAIDDGETVTLRGVAERPKGAFIVDMRRDLRQHQDDLIALLHATTEEKGAAA